MNGAINRAPEGKPAECRPTWVSWPVRGAASGSKADRVLRRKIAVYPWVPSPEDPLDEETGEPQHWESGHVRAWIREAMETLRRLPLPSDGLPAGLRSRMPAVVREVVEAYGYDRGKTRSPVSPQEIERLDRVLDWLYLFGDRRDALLVTAIALGLNLRAAGRLVGRSHEWCRQREKAVVAEFAERLNRMKSRGK